jgi:predicted GIY-YIG superfamily endonuclease
MKSDSNIKILEFIDDELRISHRIIAERTENQQKNVSELIQKYLDKLKLFGAIPIKIEVIKAGKGTTKSKTYFLNEKQVSFIFVQAKIPMELSLLFIEYGNPFKALEEFSKIEKVSKKYFVYVVDFENSNLKIGFTSSPEKRLRTLETQSGNKIINRKIVEFSSKQEALAYEKFLHSKFSDFRTRGEYFSVKFNVVLGFVENLKEFLEQK